MFDEFLTQDTSAHSLALSESNGIMANERMSPVDRAWLLMERPTNPMMIVAVIVLAARIERERLCRLVEERFLVLDRFRCRPVGQALAAEWVRAEQFDIADHVVAAALPRSAGQTELEALVGELASTQFNPMRPWWSFHLIEKYQGGSAIVVRIHHCYADGIALVRVLLQLADGTVKPRLRPVRVAGKASSGLASLGSLYAPVADLLAKTLREGADLVEHGLHYTLHPGEAVTAARGAVGAIGELARIGTLSDDPPTHLRRPLTGVRHVAWAPPLLLEEVRAIGRVLGCTINDVLVATLAGALGRYLELQGDSVTGVTLHAAVPVNMRTEADAPPELGNQFGLIFVALPVGIRHPLERLYAVHAAMKELKGSSQALVTLGLLAAVGSLPAALGDPAIALFTAKASLVASNVPGPREPLLVGGIPVSQMLFWVPQAGGIGTGVSMLTYNGQVQFGVIADRNLIADPGALVRMIETEFDQLVYVVLLGAASIAQTSA